jgi:hypothetical protein
VPLDLVANSQQVPGQVATSMARGSPSTSRRLIPISERLFASVTAYPDAERAAGAAADRPFVAFKGSPHDVAAPLL